MPIDPKADPGATVPRGTAWFVAPVLRPTLWTFVWIALAAIVTTLYLLPNAGPPGQAQLDKISHVLAFAALGLAALLAAARPGIGAPLVISVALALVLEWLQAYVPGRDSSLLDGAANLVGLAVGIAAARVIRAFAVRQVAPAA